jgi:hypothetical protein
MNACDPNIVTLIEETRCLTDSLDILNTNFLNLSSVACQLKQRVDSIKMIRTFFYYGINADRFSVDGMDTDRLSRPSNNRIEEFVNAADQLNLPPISNSGDVAYVIYQKTGYLNNRATGQNITSSYRIGGDQSVQTNNWWAPAFFIWKLVCEPTLDESNVVYKVGSGWPKIHRAESANSSPNWNKPQNWTTYNSWTT